MSDDAKTFMVEDAEIVFRNFEGREGQYNRAGDKNFVCILDPKVAEQMLADGWNVKFPEPREEGDDPRPQIQVSVNFDRKPPKVFLITETSRTQLTDSSVEVLDWADIRKVDLIARGYDWDVNGKQGTKAYLKTMFVTIEEDELERKYGIMEDSE